MHTLQSFLAVSKILPDLLVKTDLAIWATDEEKFLLFDTYGRFDIPIKAGDPLTPGGTPDLVLKTGEKISRYVPREVYGVVCQTNAYPVEGGVIGLSIGVENEETLQHALHDLDAAFEQISSSGSHIADNATAVSDFMNTIIQTINETNEQLKEIDKVGALINSIANQSRMLSLNAQIEAARAGEHGRGFSIVAREMQKLSDETTNSIKNVREVLQNINQLFSQVDGLIGNAESQIRTQSAATQEIASALEEVSVSVRDLAQLSKSL